MRPTLIKIDAIDCYGSVRTFDALSLAWETSDIAAQAEAQMPRGWKVEQVQIVEYVMEPRAFLLLDMRHYE